MRRLLSGLSIMIICSAAGAADVSVDVNPTLNALGQGSSPLSPVEIGVPLGALDDALPAVGVNQNNGLDFDPNAGQALPQLPGLNSLPGLPAEIEMPGLDGLPIQAVNNIPRNSDAPRIPGIDGLPLGFGRR